MVYARFFSLRRLQTHVHGPSPKTAVFAFVVSILAIAVAVDAIEPNLLTICPPFLLEIRIETTATSTFLPRMLRLKRPLLYHYQKRRRMSSIPPPPIFLSLVPRTMHHLLKISHSFIFTPRFYLYSRQQSGVNHVPIAAQSHPVSPLHLAHETGRPLNNVVTPRRRGAAAATVAQPAFGVGCCCMGQYEVTKPHKWGAPLPLGRGRSRGRQGGTPNSLATASENN